MADERPWDVENSSDTTVPFPDDVLTIELEIISLAKLIARDQKESQRIFELSKNTGFFNLDLRDHTDGLALLQDVDDCYRLTKRLFKSLSYEQKQEFQTRLGAGAGILDMGYVLLATCLK